MICWPKEASVFQHISLRRLKRRERQLLTAKVRDLSLAARLHQRYRIIDQVRRGYSLADAADRVGCHLPLPTIGFIVSTIAALRRSNRSPIPKGGRRSCELSSSASWLR